MSACVGCVSDPETAPPPPPHPFAVCLDAAKTSRCELDHNGAIPLCYIDGKPGPEISDAGPYPDAGCAAPKDGNTAGALGEWAWWCCTPASVPGQ